MTKASTVKQAAPKKAQPANGIAYLLLFSMFYVFFGL